MLDYEGQPWLIEVNTNPCLEESSPILQELIPRMVDDCFSLTIDRIFDQQQKHSYFPVQREQN
jgi:tubulin--tyrosine ligase